LRKWDNLFPPWLSGLFEHVHGGIFKANGCSLGKDSASQG